jgi:hypothetical protein
MGALVYLTVAVVQLWRGKVTTRTKRARVFIGQHHARQGVVAAWPGQLIDECAPEEREAALAAGYHVAVADERL